jgi:threonine/homoserine/homoserine lactone efflux protein
MFETTIDTLLRGGAVGLLSSITVGPAAVLCIKRTLSRGRHAGFASGLGVACADTLLAIIAFFFYSLLKAQIEQYANIISIIAGIFVIIIGVVIFLQKPSTKVQQEGPSSNSLWRDFFSLFGFTLANFVSVVPYITFFFAMFGVAEFEGTADAESIVSSLCVLGGFLIGATLWWFVLTLIIGLFRRGFRPHHMQTMNRVAGVIIGLLGVFTILSTVLQPTTNGSSI